jgi:hypothetical protein
MFYLPVSGLRYIQIKQVVSVYTCMFLSFDTDRYALPVSGYRHILFEL